MSGLNTAGLVDNLASHAMQLGVFDRVNTHEPKSTSRAGIWCAIWVAAIQPATSGLVSTSVRYTFTVRCASSMIQEPQDLIDTNLMNAVDLLMGAYSGDFDAGGLARNVDLLGAGGGLQAVAGYLQQGPDVFRCIDISVPVVVNDVWDQIP